jgi:hypothetical protein
MLKIATPIIFESSLEGLNALRPLFLTDHSRFLLDYSIACLNPANRIRPAVGKFLRNTDGGALLSNRVCKYPNVESLTYNFDAAHALYTYNFSQCVSFVNVYPYNKVGIPFLWWTDPSGAIELFGLSNMKSTPIVVRGCSFTIWVDFSLGTSISVKLDGFY